MAARRETAEAHGAALPHPADVADGKNAAAAAAKMKASPYVSTGDAAALLLVSRSTITNLIRAGKLHAFHPVDGRSKNRKWMLFSAEVAAYAAAQRDCLRADALENTKAIMRRRRAWGRAIAARRAAGAAAATD